jgi:hypothetical protein
MSSMDETNSGDVEIEEVDETVKTTSSEICSKKRKPYKAKSEVWGHYTKKQKTDGSKPDRANCNYCGKEFGCVSVMGTTTLWNHLKSCMKSPLSSSEKGQLKLSFGKVQEKGSINNWKFDPDKCRKSLARMIIIDELPFNIVEHKGFRAFCKDMQPLFKPISRHTIRKECIEIFSYEKAKLMKMFSESNMRICLTTDMWTSIQQLGYMCLTAHYIDNDWKMQKQIINFFPLPSPHTGKAIGKAIEQKLLEWGIDKVCTLTVDNASSNDKAAQYLVEKLQPKNSLILNGEFFHLRCSAHILNLIVKDGIDEVRSSIARIRACVLYIRSSSARMQLFRECIKKEQLACNSSLCLDVKTRWNSTYLMLESALKLQKAIERFQEDDISFEKEMKDESPIVDDWKIAKTLCEFLASFFESTKRLSGTSYITSNFYFHEVWKIEKVLHSYMASKNLDLRDMAIKMKEKFDKYWGSIDSMNVLLIVAVVLDPRYKLKFIKWCYSGLYPPFKVDRIVTKVKDALNQLYEFYESNMQGLSVVGEGTFKEQNVNSASMFANDHMQTIFEFHNFLEEEEMEECKNEVDRYLEENVQKDMGEFDILNWWKAASSKFTVLSHMARDILAIPVSTVASESAFSTGGRVLDSYRSSLAPSTVECLLCTQDWLRDQFPSVDVEEDIEELEQPKSSKLYF